LENEQAPEWLEEGMAVLSLSGAPGNDSATAIGDARAALDEAGIPCYAAVREPEETGRYSTYELLVPHAQHLQAMSVLDKELFNAELESDWKAHFETMTDGELMDMDADVLVAGMRDRIERLVRAYEDELLKRGLAELETDSTT